MSLDGVLPAVGTEVDYYGLAKYGGLVLVGVISLVAVGGLYRRRYRAEFDPPRRQVWTLEELSAMRARGDLSEEEHASLRDGVLRDMGMRPSAD